MDIKKLAKVTASAISKTHEENVAEREHRREEGLLCPKCGSNDISVQVIQTTTTTKTSKKGIGLGGHVNNTARAVAAVSTLGVSNLVWKKSKGTEKGKTKVSNETVCVCQHCGATFSPKEGMK
jgi:hypothetical protein